MGDRVPASMAVGSRVDLSLGRFLSRDWRRRPGRPTTVDAVKSVWTVEHRQLFIYRDVLLDAAMDRSDVILPSLAMRLDDDDDDDDKIIF